MYSRLCKLFSDRSTNVHVPMLGELTGNISPSLTVQFILPLSTTGSIGWIVGRELGGDGYFRRCHAREVMCRLGKTRGGSDSMSHPPSLQVKSSKGFPRISLNLRPHVVGWPATIEGRRVTDWRRTLCGGAR